MEISLHPNDMERFLAHAAAAVKGDQLDKDMAARVLMSGGAKRMKAIDLVDTFIEDLRRELS